MLGGGLGLGMLNRPATWSSRRSWSLGLSGVGLRAELSGASGLVLSYPAWLSRTQSQTELHFDFFSVHEENINVSRMAIQA